MRQITIAFKDNLEPIEGAEDESGDDETKVVFGSGARVRVALWNEHSSLVQKSDEGRHILLYMVKVSTYNNELQLGTSSLTVPVLGEKDTTWCIADDNQLPFMTDANMRGKKIASAISWTEAFKQKPPYTITVKGHLTINTVKQYQACTEGNCYKAIIKAPRGEFSYYCPSCKAPRTDARNAIHGTVKVEPAPPEQGETMEAKIYHRNLTWLQQYESQHTGPPVVFNIKVKAKVEKDTTILTVEDIVNE